MKLLTGLFIFVLLLAYGKTPALAQDYMLAAQEQAQIQSKQSTALQRLKERAQTRVENRVKILTSLQIRINEDKKLSQDQKQTLRHEVNGRIERMAELLSQLNMAQDETQLRSDFDSILGEKIYAYYVPKIHLLIAVDKLIFLSENVEQLSLRLQPLVEKLEEQEKDVEEVNEAFEDLNLRLDSIMTILKADKTALEQSTPEEYRDTFTQVRKDIAVVRMEYAKIRSDIAKIRAAINDLKTVNGNLKYNPTTTLTPKPTSLL
jgi:methyl-accepting chemotaxis protein